MRALVLLLVLACAAIAYADPKADATAAYQKGQQLYKAERYEPAAEQFELAYKLDPDPAYLYALAQSYRYAKRCAKAAEQYRLFLARTANIPNADAVKRYVDEMDRCAAEQAPPPAPPQPPPIDPPVTTREPPPSAERSGVLPEQPPPETGRGRRIARFALIGGGAVAAGVGFYFARDVGTAQRASDAIYDACAADRCQWDTGLQGKVDSLERRANRDRILYISSFAVAGVAIAAGIYLFVTDRPARRDRITITPTHQGAIVHGSF